MILLDVAMWLIDDLKVTVPPENDIQNVSSWILVRIVEVLSMKRSLISQVEQNYFIGSSVYNYGSVDQTNVVLSGITGPTTITSSTIGSTIASDSTEVIESLNSVISVGNYTGSVTVTSMGDTLVLEILTTTPT